MTLLHCACINDCSELIDILIQLYNININQTDSDGYSAKYIK